MHGYGESRVQHARELLQVGGSEATLGVLEQRRKRQQQSCEEALGGNVNLATPSRLGLLRRDGGVGTDVDPNLPRRSPQRNVR